MCTACTRSTFHPNVNRKKVKMRVKRWCNFVFVSSFLKSRPHLIRLVRIHTHQTSYIRCACGFCTEIHFVHIYTLRRAPSELHSFFHSRVFVVRQMQLNYKRRKLIRKLMSETHEIVTARHRSSTVLCLVSYEIAFNDSFHFLWGRARGLAAASLLSILWRLRVYDELWGNAKMTTTTHYSAFLCCSWPR